MPACPTQVPVCQFPLTYCPGMFLVCPTLMLPTMCDSIGWRLSAFMGCDQIRSEWFWKD